MSDKISTLYTEEDATLWPRTGHRKSETLNLVVEGQESGDLSLFNVVTKKTQEPNVHRLTSEESEVLTHSVKGTI